MTHDIPQPARFALRLIVLLWAAGFWCLHAERVNAQQPGGLFDAVGELLREAFREAPEEAAAPAAAPEVEAQALPLPVGAVVNIQLHAPLVDAATRQQRLDAWCAALEDTLTQELELSQDQRAQLKKLVLKEAAFNQQRWKQRQEQSTAMPDTTVILFGGTTGPTRRILRAVDRAFATMLTEQQLETWTEQARRRHQRIGDWFAQRAACVISAELFLSVEQTEACVQDLRSHTARRSNGLYAFHHRTAYLPYEPLESLLRRIRSVTLTESQQQRLNDLKVAAQNNHHVILMVNAGSDEQNEEQLRATCQKVREQMLTAAAVRAEYISTSLQLGPRQARHLEVAGKGVAIRHLKAWKQRARVQLQQFAGNQQPGLAMGLHVPGPAPISFESDRIWQRAIQRVCDATDSDSTRMHARQEQQGATAFVMGTLDRELCLRASQVESLSQLVQESEPHRVLKPQEMALELAMLARTLVRVDEDRLQELLSQPQRECWETMKAQFRYQGRERATMTTPHGELLLLLGGPPQRGSDARQRRLF